MKKRSGFLFCLFISVVAFGQSDTTGIAIIPEPVNIVKNTGVFSLPANIVIEAGSQPELKQTITVLQNRLSVPTGLHCYSKQFCTCSY
ncbi:MAG: hypothetical protein WKG06_43895 [Segetibacter sp.]